MPVNMLPVGYMGQSQSQSHGQSSYSSDDLPKTVVMTLNQGSVVKSMEFHPIQQVLLLGKCLVPINITFQTLSMLEIGKIILFYIFLY